MNPQAVFCPNLDCPASAATKGTIFYRLKTEPQTVILVLTLLAYGCPVQAVVAAFGFDERPVKDWWQKAGAHCQQVHERVVGQSQLDLGQVQADEIKAKLQGGVVWMAMAMMVSTRLWLGGEISRRRDKALIEALVGRVRAMALCRPLLVAVDGLPSYVGAFYRAFRSKVPRNGQGERAKLRVWSELNLVQVVKQRTAGQLTIQRRIVQGCTQQITALIQTSQGHGGINTAFIERLNATFPERLTALTRRTRGLARQPETLQAGIYILGCVYNFCTYHQSLRVPFYLANGGCRWLQRTPAIAAGSTDHRWTMTELFLFKISPPQWTPPKRRGRPSKETLRLIEQWCT